MTQSQNDKRVIDLIQGSLNVTSSRLPSAGPKLTIGWILPWSLPWLCVCLVEFPYFLASLSLLLTELPLFLSRVLVVVAEFEAVVRFLITDTTAHVSFPHRSHEVCVCTFSAVDFELLVMKVHVNKETTHWTFRGKVCEGMIDDVIFRKLTVRMHDYFVHVVDCGCSELFHIVLVAKDKEADYM